MSRRNGRISLNLQALQFVAQEHDRPSEEISRRIASPSVVLPEPDSPTMPRVSPAPHLDRDAVHRLDVADHLAQHAALDREPDLEIVGADHHRRRRIERRRIALGLGGEQRARVGMLRRREHLLRRGPCSTILPCFITQTRSAILRTMPRSWVMNRIAMPRRVCRSFEQLAGSAPAR